MATPDSGLGLLGRQSERSALDVLVSAVRAGRSRTLVLRGDAGVGKSALLRYVAERGADCRMLHAVGVEAEMERERCGMLAVSRSSFVIYGRSSQSRKRNIGRAATRLFITQPALSRQMQQLEGELGEPLLVRVPHGVELTEAGRELLDKARVAIEAAEDALAVGRAPPASTIGSGAKRSPGRGQEA